ncbi:MAG TPA: response regulator [Prolixibacteraceae bacterium]|jgi:two-component system CheB/CheR fusion protein|nr:response regulator [Prolixibacteraceae bacterium]HPR85929.1 response regulator [Prolixibacteraceae bacterium]
MEYNFVGKTILIVEDEAVSRLLFEKALKKTKANLFFVKDGLEAVNMVRENDEIDVVLMDIRLPRMNGFEAVEKIKEINPDLPVIIQTAYAMDSTKEEAQRLGCDDFVTKPIIIESLLNILRKHLLYWVD